LQDNFASVFHAQIVYRSGQWWIEDRRSHNGTSLNDVPIDEAVVLSSGDIIRIGCTKLLVDLE
jgi:pSer/pThr/pTyr-binding forkhead associated (FHA) protein